MKISEMIAALKSLKDKHGDVECWVKNYNLDVIERAKAPYYESIICAETNYIKEFIPDCHPRYYGVFFDAD